MENTRKLVLEEKIFLRKQGQNPKDFLLLSKTSEGYVFIHRKRGVEAPYRR